MNDDYLCKFISYLKLSKYYLSKYSYVSIKRTVLLNDLFENVEKDFY